IIAAIVDGTAPADLTVTGLAKALPYSWAEQEERVGLSLQHRRLMPASSVAEGKSLEANTQPKRRPSGSRCAVFTAIIAFAVLPGLETFEAFSLAIGLYLIPVGALVAQPRQTVIFTAMIVGFGPLLAPANEMSYDPQQFYNSALAIFAGSGAAALSFRLLRPLSPAFRARRLLALTLRDLRRLATGPIPRAPGDWEGRMYGRLAVCPDVAEPLQRSQFLAALAVGSEIIQLRHIATRLGLGSDLDLALEAAAQGNSAIATTRLARLDDRLASLPGAGLEASLALHARGSILAITEALIDHASYFDAGAPV
ncbi:MAG: FUSC family protein, partial [Methylocella sp.]